MLNIMVESFVWCFSVSFEGLLERGLQQEESQSSIGIIRQLGIAHLYMHIYIPCVCVCVYSNCKKKGQLSSFF
jgi:hypothetical protein